MPIVHRVSIVPDYFVRWPIKVDGTYDEEVRDRLSPELIADVEALASWWQMAFASSPVGNAPSDPSIVAAWRSRLDAVSRALEKELGPGYYVSAPANNRYS